MCLSRMKMHQHSSCVSAYLCDTTTFIGLYSTHCIVLFNEVKLGYWDSSAKNCHLQYTCCINLGWVFVLVHLWSMPHIDLCLWRMVKQHKRDSWSCCLSQLWQKRTGIGLWWVSRRDRDAVMKFYLQERCFLRAGRKHLSSTVWCYHVA